MSIDLGRMLCWWWFLIAVDCIVDSRVRLQMYVQWFYRFTSTSSTLVWGAVIVCLSATRCAVAAVLQRMAAALVAVCSGTAVCLVVYKLSDYPALICCTVWDNLPPSNHCFVYVCFLHERHTIRICNLAFWISLQKLVLVLLYYIKQHKTIRHDIFYLYKLSLMAAAVQRLQSATKIVYTVINWVIDTWIVKSRDTLIESRYPCACTACQPWCMVPGRCGAVEPGCAYVLLASLGAWCQDAVAL